jgi:hypothetical protein
MPRRSTLLRIRRLWKVRHGATWAFSLLLLAAYAVMVAEQIRAAVAAPGGSGPELARQAEEPARELARIHQRQ